MIPIEDLNDATLAIEDTDKDEEDEDGLITDRVFRYCCQNSFRNICIQKTSKNPVKKITACPLAGES